MKSQLLLVRVVFEYNTRTLEQLVSFVLYNKNQIKFIISSIIIIIKLFLAEI